VGVGFEGYAGGVRPYGCHRVISVLTFFSTVCTLKIFLT
jgi:hypothetical protein